MKVGQLLKHLLWPTLALGCSSASPSAEAHDGGTSQAGDGANPDASQHPDTGTIGGDAGAHGESGATVEDARTPPESGGTTEDAAAPNATAVVVNQGPPGTSNVNTAFVSVRVCSPGTSQCQTVDYVAVDTGSQGLRILSSALTVSLPQVKASTGDSLVECYSFVEGYAWGSIHNADVRVGGELASNIPIQVVGDPAFASVPTNCSSEGPSVSSLATLGYNGLLGINPIVPDCGDYCSESSNAADFSYYSCTGSACTTVQVATANQVANPIAFFASADTNGAILELPNVASGGQPSLSGTLTFGIGTAANNELASTAAILTVDENADFSTLFNGQTLTSSFLDSGTNTFAFDDPSIAQCTPQQVMYSGYYCPATPVSLAAQNVGLNHVTSNVTFTIESTQTLFGGPTDPDYVFNDLASTVDAPGSFFWGLPFFMGRRVYVAIAGASTPGGLGPYFAY